MKMTPGPKARKKAAEKTLTDLFVKSIQRLMKVKSK
jgi:hypothetical protein